MHDYDQNRFLNSETFRWILTNYISPVICEVGLSSAYYHGSRLPRVFDGNVALNHSHPAPPPWPADVRAWRECPGLPCASHQTCSWIWLSLCPDATAYIQWLFIHSKHNRNGKHWRQKCGAPTNYAQHLPHKGIWGMVSYWHSAGKRVPHLKRENLETMKLWINRPFTELWSQIV